jgi:hypothetical protein
MALARPNSPFQLGQPKPVGRAWARPRTAYKRWRDHRRRPDRLGAWRQSAREPATHGRLVGQGFVVEGLSMWLVEGEGGGGSDFGDDVPTVVAL